jgi:dTDP-4-amino-4,6-dideoxygalactose transaminase
MTELPNRTELAIDGGPKTRNLPYPKRRALGTDEAAMVQEVLAYYANTGNDPGYQGTFEDRYCHAFVRALGGGYADAVATGTSALFVAVAALGLPADSEILVSPITDPGTLSAIILKNHRVRLIDAAAGSYNTSFEQVMARITPQTRAVMLVHSIGQAVPGIARLARELKSRNIFLIEDCSQSHGALADGQPIGTFGDIAAYSTMYRKAHITGGAGGVVYSRNIDLFHQAEAHADRGKPRWIENFDDRNPAHFLYPALNHHTDEISCAVGIASLNRLPETIAKRRQFVEAMQKAITEQCKGFSVYPLTQNDSPFVMPVKIDPYYFSRSCLDVAFAVRAEGVDMNPHYAYLAKDWPWLVPYLTDDFEPINARQCRDHSFVLYLNENYGATEVEDVISALVKVEYYLGRSA